MFRPMRRFKQELPREECDEVLLGGMRGVMALLGDDDYPYAVPLDYLYEPSERRIYFHGAREGHKVDALRAHEKASFCVMSEGVPARGRFGLDVRSVICFGRLHEVEPGAATIEVVRALGLRYVHRVYPDVAAVDKEVRQAGGRTLCYYLDIEHMTGKLVNES